MITFGFYDTIFLGDYGMTEDLYNILIDNNVFTHGIGKVDDLQLPQTLWKFNNIIKQGGLYSKDSLKQLGIVVTGKFAGNIRMTKEIFVSLFDPTIYTLKDKLLSKKIKQYPIDLNEITFLIDRKVEEDLTSQRNDFDYTEVMVKDKIPNDYFRGIIIPSKEGLLEKISQILLQYDVDLPIYDFFGNLLNDKMYRK